MRKKIKVFGKDSMILEGKSKIEKYISNWYRLSCPVIDLDNVGEIIPSLTEKQWEKVVLKDVMKIIREIKENKLLIHTK